MVIRCVTQKIGAYMRIFHCLSNSVGVLAEFRKSNCLRKHWLLFVEKEKILAVWNSVNAFERPGIKILLQDLQQKGG